MVGSALSWAPSRRLLPAPALPRPPAGHAEKERPRAGFRPGCAGGWRASSPRRRGPRLTPSTGPPRKDVTRAQRSSLSPLGDLPQGDMRTRRQSQEGGLHPGEPRAAGASSGRCPRGLPSPVPRALSREALRAAHLHGGQGRAPAARGRAHTRACGGGVPGSRAAGAVSALLASVSGHRALLTIARRRDVPGRRREGSSEGKHGRCFL